MKYNKTNEKKQAPVLKPTKKFHGFAPQTINSFQMPKELDLYLCELPGPALKILIYIVRHTWGWNKPNDRISYPQFKNGITKKDGTVYDRGTGLCINTIISSLNKLERSGFIHVQRRKGKTTIYSLTLRKTAPKQNQPIPQNERVPIPQNDTPNTNTNNRILCIPQNDRVEAKKDLFPEKRMQPTGNKEKKTSNLEILREKVHRGL